jgi:uncharacterized membrane protein
MPNDEPSANPDAGNGGTAAGSERNRAWTFRGHQMQPAEFTTAMVQMYQAEMQRANTWRTRLDNTSQWAVIAAGAAILFAFASPDQYGVVLILSTLFVTLFLWIESRRYRYYELWSHRVRLMETDFFAAMLVPPFAPSPEWAESLAESLLQPDFPISMWEAFGRRFRRNYVALFVILGLAWLARGFLYPTPATSLGEFVARSGFGLIPGSVVLGLGLLYNGVLFLVGFATAGLRHASGEVLPKFGDFPVLGDFLSSPAGGAAGAASAPGAAEFRRRQQLLIWLVSNKPKVIAQRILTDMKRGVTSLHGQGMYTQQEREVLMVAITVTEVARLKALVEANDPNALMIVTSAQEILGRGFKPLAHAA